MLLLNECLNVYFRCYFFIDSVRKLLDTPFYVQLYRFSVINFGLCLRRTSMNAECFNLFICANSIDAFFYLCDCH